MELPLISFTLPTYNEERNIERCLKSIFSQNYPEDKIEVIVIDDGSRDTTVEICGRYPVRILQYPHAGPDAHRWAGVEAAKGEFVVLLSADNELSSQDWILKMVKPVLEDMEIVGGYPSPRAPREDPAINRYCALLQTTPLESYLMWQLRRPKEIIAKEGYFLQVFGEYSLLPIGSNGTLLRREAVLKVGNVPSYPFGADIDLICRLVKEGFIKYAYVPEAGVYHYHVRSYWDFARSLRRRVKAFSQYPREYPWLPRQRGEFFKTLGWILFCSTFVGPFIHAFRIRKKGDPAWLYHPLACFTEVMIYGFTLLTSKKGLGLLLRMVKASAKGH